MIASKFLDADLANYTDLEDMILSAEKQEMLSKVQQKCSTAAAVGETTSGTSSGTTAGNATGATAGTATGTAADNTTAAGTTAADSAAGEAKLLEKENKADNLIKIFEGARTSEEQRLLSTRTARTCTHAPACA